MISVERSKLLRDLRIKRSEAHRHMLQTIKQQEQVETFLPAISQSVIIELADYIERTDQRIDELDDEFDQGDIRRYVQAAFSFLHGCAIDDSEIPF